MDLPVSLTKAEWDKKKGLLNKIGSPDTGIGEMLKKLEPAFKGVDWDKFDKKKVWKESERSLDKFLLAENHAKQEKKKAEVVEKLLKEILKAANEHKAKIKQCVVVGTDAKKLADEITELTFLDWDDAKLSLKEAQDELDWYIEARKTALERAKKLRKDFENELVESRKLIDTVRKSLQTIVSKDGDVSEKKKLLEAMVDQAASLQTMDDEATREYNATFANDKKMMDQRQSPKHDIAEALNKAGGDFALQMIEVDGIQKAMRELEVHASEGGALLEEARDELEADKRSIEDWKKSLDASIKEISNLGRTMNEKLERVTSKARDSETAHLASVKDPKISKQEKVAKKNIYPVLIKEFNKQFDNFATAAASMEAKLSRGEKVPENVKADVTVKPLIAAYAALKKVPQEARAKAQQDKLFYEKTMMEVIKLVAALDKK